MRILEFNKCWHPFFLCLLIIGFTSCRSEENPAPIDNTPDEVTFQSATQLEISTFVSSDEVTISGISGTVEFVVSNYKGAGLSVNGAAPVAKGTLKSGDKVKLQLTTPDEFKKSFSVKIKIGTKVFEWLLTTKEAPISFTDQEDIKISTPTESAEIESPEVTVKDIETPQTISVSGYDGAQLVINGQDPVTSGTVSSGDKVKVIFTAPKAYDEEIEITVKVGEIESTWKVTTQSPPVAPSIKLKLKAFGKEYDVTLEDELTAKVDVNTGTAYVPSTMPVIVESIELIGEGTSSTQVGDILDMDDKLSIQIETTSKEENIITNEKDTKTFTITFSNNTNQLSGFDRLYTPPTDDELNRFVIARGSQQSMVSYKGKLYYIACNAWGGETEPGNNISMWRSDDGNLWEKIYDRSTAPDDQKFPGFFAPMVVFKGKIWLFGGKHTRPPFDDTNQGENSVWSTEDGITWNEELANDPTATDRFPRTTVTGAAVVVFNDEIYHIPGRISRSTTEPNYTNEIWKSKNGIDWEQVPDVNNSRYPARGFASFKVFKDKLWVIFGYNGSETLTDVWSSKDGTEWVKQSDDPLPGGRRNGGVLVHDEKLWIISGIKKSTDQRDNEVWSSVDGINWVQATDNARFVPRANFGATVHDGEMWIVGGSVNTKNFWANLKDVWSSENGEKWIDHKTLNTVLAGNTATMYNNRLWLIGGAGGNQAYVWSSEDGMNWIKDLGKADIGKNNVPFGNPYAHSATVFKDKLWVAGGYDLTSKSATNGIWYSSDGYNWKEAVANGSSGSVFSPRYQFTLNEYKGKLWVIGGYDGSNTFNEVWSSADGQNWTQETEPPFTGRRGHSAVVLNEKLYVIGGLDPNEDSNNEVWSFDGTTWTEELPQDENATNRFAPRSYFAMTVIDNQMLVIGGTTSEVSTNDIWGSYDGKNWFKYLENENSEFPKRLFHNANVMNGKLVISGGNGSDPADIWISR